MVSEPLIHGDTRETDAQYAERADAVKDETEDADKYILNKNLPGSKVEYNKVDSKNVVQSFLSRQKNLTQEKLNLLNSQCCDTIRKNIDVQNNSEQEQGSEELAASTQGNVSGNDKYTQRPDTISQSGDRRHSMECIILKTGNEEFFPSVIVTAEMKYYSCFRSY
ncbi:uncharacterized protein [Haliotis asinina]|uniref:uncharacterized protein n=1 Tax=Haliotis asinina TaxID=109174 RepID=UPI0035318A98